MIPVVAFWKAHTGGKLAGAYEVDFQQRQQHTEPAYDLTYPPDCSVFLWLGAPDDGHRLHTSLCRALSFLRCPLPHGPSC